MKTNIADIIIFTDGASSGNPGPGGWGAIIAEKGSRVFEIGGSVSDTTNNRMELTAAISALECITESRGVVIVYTDSMYVRNGMQCWVPVWQRRGWKTAAKTEVLNQDLWQRLATLVADRAVKAKMPVIWRLVGGHENVPANERVDTIATSFAAGKPPTLFSGSLDAYGIDLAIFANTEMVDTSLLGLARRKHNKNATKKSKVPAYSYISMVGGVVAIHKTWRECFTRIKGVSGARFKKAISSDDEKRIIADFKSL